MVHEASQNVPINILDGDDKKADDPRIISTRKWLRRFGFDEIPQIINIIKGEMVFFGPRPTSLARYENYSDKQKQHRKNVTPGIFSSYALSSKGDKKRTLLELEDIYLYLRRRKERESKSMIMFNTWVFVNVIKAILQGANK